MCNISTNPSPPTLRTVMSSEGVAFRSFRDSALQHHVSLRTAPGLVPGRIARAAADDSKDDGAYIMYGKAINGAEAYVIRGRECGNENNMLVIFTQTERVI